MAKQIFFYLNLFFILFYIKIYSHDHFVEIEQIENFTYVLKIQFPDHIKNIPPIKGYYKGKQLFFEQGFCQISERKSCSSFIIFITKPQDIPIAKIEGNNIKYLERLENKPFKLFKLTYEYNFDLDKKIWKISQTSNQNLPLKIPQDSIILLLDPEFVDKISEINNFDYKFNEKIGNTYLTCLPRIIINKKITENKLNKLSKFSFLAGCDLDAFHVNTQDKKQSKNFNSVIVSMQTV